MASSENRVVTAAQRSCGVGGAKRCSSNDAELRWRARSLDTETTRPKNKPLPCKGDHNDEDLWTITPCICQDRRPHCPQWPGIQRGAMTDLGLEEEIVNVINGSPRLPPKRVLPVALEPPLSFGFRKLAGQKLEAEASTLRAFPPDELRDRLRAPVTLERRPHAIHHLGGGQPESVRRQPPGRRHRVTAPRNRWS